MKITVVVPALNEAKTIARTVEHLKRTGGPNLLEILVVDAKSSDRTAFLAEKAGARVVDSEVKNRAFQMNLGAKTATGEVLYFVHADVLPPETWAADILAALGEGHEMGCFRARFDSENWLLRINSWCTRLPFSWCQGGDKTFFIRKKDFFGHGGYDETMVLMEEYAFLKRAGRAGKRLFIVPKNATVSTRKYAMNSWLRVNLTNFFMFNLYRIGASSAFLKRVYSRLLRS